MAIACAREVWMFLSTQPVRGKGQRAVSSDLGMLQTLVMP